MSHVALLLALLIQTGELRLAIEGEHGDVDAFPVDPLVDAMLLDHHLQLGLSMDPMGTKVDDVKRSGDSKNVTLALKPGTYHFRVKTGAGAIWLTNQKIDAAKPASQTVKITAGGTVSGMCMLDKSRQEGKPMEGLKAALVRDGRVWARVEGKPGSAFEFKGVPAGTYALVVTETFEWFVAVKEDVRVEEGGSAPAKIDVKRASLGGVMVGFTDKAGKAAPPPDKVFLVDPKGRFAIAPNRGQSQGDVELVGWGGLPGGAGYVVRASGLEHKGLTLRPPTVKGQGIMADETYETVKVAVGK